MDRTTPVIIIAIVTVLALIGMYLGWRARVRRQASLPRPQVVPEDIGRTLYTRELLYVATTVAGDPLDRIAVSGLAFPGRASIAVAERGVVLAIVGARQVFVPTADLRGVGRATWTIDRAVESGGLVVIGWTLVDPSGGSANVDTYLRVVADEDPSPLIEAINGRIAATSGSGQ